MTGAVNSALTHNQLFLVFQWNGTLADTLHLELGLNLQDLKIAEIRWYPVNGFLKGVGKGWQTIFTVKKLKGVVVYDVGRCRGQIRREGFEVVENFAVSVINRAVAFIDRDEVEKMRRSLAISFSPTLGQRGSLGKCSLKASKACSLSAMRSTRNSTFSAWAARISRHLSWQCRCESYQCRWPWLKENHVSFVRCLPAQHGWHGFDNLDPQSRCWWTPAWAACDCDGCRQSVPDHREWENQPLYMAEHFPNPKNRFQDRWYRSRTVVRHSTAFECCNSIAWLAAAKGGILDGFFGFDNR